MSDPALDALRDQVLEVNLGLPAAGLVTLTWGNASGIDRERGLVAIKPSGVAYAALRREDIVVLALADGTVVGQGGRPSTDAPTHLALYRALPAIGGIVHTHSRYATAWAQSAREIPVLGTTHADLCDGPIPLARQLSAEEIEADYEGRTGAILIEAIGGRDPLAVPCALVPGHAPFCWGRTPAAALTNAATLEEVARMALLTIALDPSPAGLPEAVRAKHFSRKHGPAAYYGQG